MADNLRSARLVDIAAQAGVSEATVSRVLNDKPGVAPATRQSVLTALDVLGYERPSRLRPRQARTVGLITPELNNPIFPAFAQVIETHLVHAGFTPVLCTQTEGGVHEDEYVRMLLDRAVSGIVYVCGQHADTETSIGRYARLRARGLPIVLINGYREGVDAPFISDDDEAAMQLAVRHLADLGHERIGLAVGPKRYVSVQRKIEGYARAMAECVGADAVLHVEAAAFTLEGGSSAAGRLLEQGVTGIVSASDLMALGAVAEARTRHLEVPRDLSIVGYDDSLLIAFTDPPLTTVRQNVRSIAEAAVRSLLDEIEGHPAPRTERLFKPELVIRGSTGVAPKDATISGGSGASRLPSGHAHLRRRP
jgi:DNA-binding LacI/PurR family transcriptional regulator